jgi:very-short-patch-repair endonuclease
VELDGETHSSEDEIAADARRTAFLNEQGYQVVRFTNQQVYENADAVADTILVALGEDAG